MKKNATIDIPRLCVAMQRARLMLRRYRAERREMVRQYVGSHWAEEGTREAVPVNLIALYVSVVGRNLIAKEPRVMLSTFDRQNKPMVSAMQSWANKEIEHLHLQGTLQRVVTDALFSVGIAKVALATPAESASVAWNLRAGQPFCERVDLDDFVYDIHARDFSEVGFIGHRYRAPLEVVREDKSLSRQRKDIAASYDNPYNLEGDERVSTLGRGIYAGNLEEFEDFVDLWEVYLPRHRLVLTLADDNITGAAASGTGGVGDALRAQRFLGPETGPYHVLGYQTVPGNAMPKGPLQDLIDLHEEANRSYRKVIRMCDRIKEVTAVQGGAMEDGSRVMEADDGQIIRLDNPDRIKQLIFGGTAVQSVLAVATVLKDLFDFMAGNLALLAGAGPQSKTATQDKMLNENASRTIVDMQETTVRFTGGVIRSLCWYWHHDPFKVMKSKYTLPGMPEMGMARQVQPQQRQKVPFEDLQIQVDPYSLQHQTPQQRMQALDQVVTQILMPMQALLQAQGVKFDVNAYLQKKAQYGDMPDLAEIITIGEPPQQDPSGGGEKPGMPQETTRNYVRESMPGRTDKGNNQNLVNTLLGVNAGGNPNGQPAINGAAK